MKRRQLVKHLEACGCKLYGEGAKHSKYRNPATGTPPQEPERPFRATPR